MSWRLIKEVVFLVSNLLTDPCRDGVVDFIIYLLAVLFFLVYITTCPFFIIFISCGCSLVLLHLVVHYCEYSLNTP